MIAVDTNILVRLLTGDHPEQSRAARRFMEARSADDPIYICRDVLLELVWVLTYSYRHEREDVAQVLYDLLIAPDVMIEAEAEVRAIWQRYEATPQLDFVDAMIAAAAERSGARELVTFDRRLAKLANVRLLEA
jgi:predicted nucleic-acid-binding protein